MALTDFVAGQVLTAQQLDDSFAAVDWNENVIINGAMQVAQRATSVAGITTSSYNTADRYTTFMSSLGTWTQSVDADAPTGSGFRNSLKMLCTTAAASPGASSYLILRQMLEGQNVQQFAKGTALAKTFAVSFWVKSNAPGTYICELEDDVNARTVSASYTISASGVWEKKTINFPADTTGALANNNAFALGLNFWLSSGSDFKSGSLATTWGTRTNANRDVGQTNLASAINNYWQVTGIQLQPERASQFAFQDYGTVLAQCQRYFIRIQGYSLIYHAVGSGNTNCRGGIVSIPTTMRALPTFTERGTLNLLNSNLTDRGVAGFDNQNQRPGAVGFNTVSNSNSVNGEFLWCEAGTSSDGLDLSAEL